ncbi:MAG: hypothetical protein FWF83_05895, partial [Clostridiales bacterium]|nr:hypothetical protein [Clostridiales bacterium]
MARHVFIWNKEKKTMGRRGSFAYSLGGKQKLIALLLIISMLMPMFIFPSLADDTAFSLNLSLVGRDGVPDGTAYMVGDSAYFTLEIKHS